MGRPIDFVFDPRWDFRGWRIEWTYFRLDQIQDHGRQPSCIILNGHISETVHPSWVLPTTADLTLVWRGRDRFRSFNDHSRLLPAPAPSLSRLHTRHTPPCVFSDLFPTCYWPRNDWPVYYIWRQLMTSARPFDVLGCIRHAFRAPPGPPEQRSACFSCVPGASRAQGEHNRALARSLLEVTGTLRPSTQASFSIWRRCCCTNVRYVAVFAVPKLCRCTTALVITLFDTLDYRNNVAQVVKGFFCSLTLYNVSSAPGVHELCSHTFYFLQMSHSCVQLFLSICNKLHKNTVNTHETYSTDTQYSACMISVFGSV